LENAGAITPNPVAAAVTRLKPPENQESTTSFTAIPNPNLPSVAQALFLIANALWRRAPGRSTASSLLETTSPFSVAASRQRAALLGRLATALCRSTSPRQANWNEPRPGKPPNLKRGGARILVLDPNDRLPLPVQSLADSATSVGL